MIKYVLGLVMGKGVGLVFPNDVVICLPLVGKPREISRDSRSPESFPPESYMLADARIQCNKCPIPGVAVGQWTGKKSKDQDLPYYWVYQFALKIAFHRLLPIPS